MTRAVQRGNLMRVIGYMQRREPSLRTNTRQIYVNGQVNGPDVNLYRSEKEFTEALSNRFEIPPERAGYYATQSRYNLLRIRELGDRRVVIRKIGDVYGTLEVNNSALIRGRIPDSIIKKFELEMLEAAINV